MLKRIRIKKHIQAIVIVPIMGIIGFLMLVAAYAIPNGRIEYNVYRSCTFFENTENKLMDYDNSSIDSYTDALMLLTAAHVSDDNPFYAAIDCARYEMSDMWPEESLVAIYGNNQVPSEEFSYGRYWHGYLIFLKPLLYFINYGEIRSLLVGVQMLLFSIILMKLYNNKRILVPFFISWIFLNPISTMLCLQYNTVTLITFVSMLFVLFMHERWDENNFKWFLAFEIIGAITSYFDLLTYPLVTLGMPLILWYSLSLKMNLKEMLNKGFSMCSAWTIGYGGLWVFKWVLGDLIGNSDIIRSAVEAILFRTSSNLGEIQFGYLDVLKEQFASSIQYTWIVILCVLVIVGMIKLFYKKVDYARILIYVLVGALPFCWYFAMKNHSYIHARFTYRNLVISVFALAVAALEKTKGKES